MHGVFFCFSRVTSLKLLNLGVIKSWFPKYCAWYTTAGLKLVCMPRKLKFNCFRCENLSLNTGYCQHRARWFVLSLFKCHVQWETHRKFKSPQLVGAWWFVKVFHYAIQKMTLQKGFWRNFETKCACKVIMTPWKSLYFNSKGDNLRIWRIQTSAVKPWYKIVDI